MEPTPELKLIIEGNEEYFNSLLSRIDRDRLVLKGLPMRIGANTVDHQLLIIIAAEQLEVQHLLASISYQIAKYSQKLDRVEKAIVSHDDNYDVPDIRTLVEYIAKSIKDPNGDEDTRDIQGLMENIERGINCTD